MQLQGSLEVVIYPFVDGDQKADYNLYVIQRDALDVLFHIKKLDPSWVNHIVYHTYDSPPVACYYWGPPPASYTYDYHIHNYAIIYKVTTASDGKPDIQN